MTTGREIITDAYIAVGKHDPFQTLDSTLQSYGLRCLNRLLSNWTGLEIPYTISESFSGSGVAPYTMGSGGTASSARARKIISAYTEDSNSLSYLIDIIDRTKYNNIHNKSLSGRPEKLFYDPLYPVGYIYLWKVPDSSYTVYIESEKILDSLASATASFTLDPMYEQALFLNLRNILAYPGFTVTQLMILEADRALDNIKRLNAANRVEESQLPPEFGGRTYSPKTIEDG